MTFTTKQKTSQLIYGPAGKLETKVTPPSAAERGAWGIVCHPHPLFGGTMENKVVTTLAKTFQCLGLATVQFNFRGVGESEGEFDQGRGELADLLAVIDWVRKERPSHEIWLAGFSFGAYIAAKASIEVKAHRLVTVAPPVTNFAMHDLPPIQIPWILVQGEKDEVIAAEKVFQWAESRDPKPTILRFPEASHYFHGQLLELRERLDAVLRE